MKFKLSGYIKGALFLCVLAAGLLLKPNQSLAAETDTKLDGVKQLVKDTVYEYDLNGDGAADKIQYKVTVNEDQYKTTLKLYINDKLYLSKKDSGFSFSVKLLDLDRSDNYLDFFINTSLESDCVKNAFFIRYDGEHRMDQVNFNIGELLEKFSTYRYSIEKVPGDGSFYIAIDTPVYSEAIGCYYCYIPFRLKDNKISVVPVKTYTLNKFSREYKYKAAKSFSVYEKVGSKKVVFKVAKKDTVTFDKMYVSKAGNAYFRVVNSKGKKGWIKSAQANLFVEFPAWG